jgi:predicted CoA-substrate-specific enzyme activase
MSIALGIDIGLVSIKAALVGDSSDVKFFERIAGHSIFTAPAPTNDEDILSEGLRPFAVTEYRRIRGKPVEAASVLLDDIFRVISPDEIRGVRICGSGGKLVSEIIHANRENEFRALARGVGFLYPSVATLFEMGGENSKFIRLERDSSSGDVGIVDYEKSGDCAAGTGSFLDQQASRLRFSIEEIGAIVTQIDTAPKIAGRCSVFAKTDMIHAQQRGYGPDEVLKGLCEAVARNFKSTITKGKKISHPVLFTGGVAMNTGVVRAMEDAFSLPPGTLIVPRFHSWIAAIGAALLEEESDSGKVSYDVKKLNITGNRGRETFPTNTPLDLESVVLLRDRVHSIDLHHDQHIDAYLGIDVGSVSTNLALIDGTGKVLKEIYLRTDGRPIEVVNRGLDEISRELAHRVQICGVGTTGSGRELIGELVGADTVNDEITAHKTGAEFIADSMLDTEVDTIFEIGGQDSKFISIEDGVVVDFAMNEACAAGTGSFLEERAEELEINIIDQFAAMALNSKSPIRLGERCTVFMEQDVNSYLQRGASREDLVAGLAYSIVINYLNRVVRGRKIGNVIFFQGGTAYNDSIAAAFSKVLKKDIIVPPYNGVIGAIGAALLAREKMNAVGGHSQFRGYSLDEVDYRLREFTCRGCSNFCNIQEFEIEGEKTYWGDQCSDRYRKRRKVEKAPVIEDLISLREELLFQDVVPEGSGKMKIGIPRSMYTFEKFPLWNRFFAEIGWNVVLSGETKKDIRDRGVDAVVSEPCFPIKVAHGHVDDLFQKGVDYIFLPNILNMETPFMDVESWVCVWGQTLPFVVMNSPNFEPLKERFLVPTIEFRKGFERVAESLSHTLNRFGCSFNEVKHALKAGYDAQREFEEKLRELGRNALEILTEKGEKGVVLLGRSYNINDRGMNIDIPRKIRDYYGVNIIPMDFLPVDDMDISSVTDNMFWSYGRKIIAAARLAGKYPNLHMIYITNFKCGPDSYIKHYINSASGKKSLFLQFDGHQNDAGFMTRCEAYLDSNGFLRWWHRKSEEDSPWHDRGKAIKA